MSYATTTRETRTTRTARRRARRAERRRRTTSVIAGLMLLSVGGIAVAAWLSTGSGTGAVLAGESQDLAVEVGPAEIGELYPTHAVDLEVEVTNPNPYNLLVTDVDATSLTSVPAACADDVSWGGAYGGGVVIADGATATIPLADALTMTHDAADGCQGAEFSVEILVSGESTDQGAS